MPYAPVLRTSRFCLLVALVTVSLPCGIPATAAEREENLLRNGSFEGGLLYWHNIEPENHRLLRGDAPAGEYALRIDKGSVMSAPFIVQPGGEFTVSLFAKAQSEGEIQVQAPPSAREDGQNAKRLWTQEGTQTAKVGPQWKRISFTWKADVPQSGFWPNPHYMVLIQGNVPLVVDGVTVRPGKEAASDYVPRRAVEVLADCPDLKGYQVDGNLLEKGAAVRVVAHASNPTTKDRAVTLRWQWIDYEGKVSLSKPIEKRVILPAGKTLNETAAMNIERNGCMLARVSAVDGDVLDSSDLPLTSLAYPFNARRPDSRERFGASFFGPRLPEVASRVGFAWSRWFPHTKWQDHQPDGPDSWHWFDKELDGLEKLGMSTNLVLYGWPKWIMDEQHPLPKDMRWKADDPRWDDLTVETAWDRYMKETAKHYRGRSVIYEIENEPEFDRWDKLEEEYAKFTIRSARQIKQIDPKARVMVDNVWGIPGGLNRRLLEPGAAKHIDIISWHDYHEGWLADAAAMKRMRAALDGLGGKHVEIWFNEGWAFTNTAVDEPMACTRLNSAESTNAMVCSIAELTANGQEKTILFHAGYEQHGMSFWDYYGPGTAIWDWYGYPMPLVAAWNTLIHHIGLSDRIGFVRPEGANFCIFEDLRNHRGVMIAYADRDAKADVAIDLPTQGLTAEDAMGNAKPMESSTLVLSRTGRPVFLYDAKGTSGKEFLAKLEPLDRRHAGFVVRGGATVRLPNTWEGDKKGSAKGNPVLADGKPVWRLDQVWPVDPAKTENYRPLVWGDNFWMPVGDAFGGQPKAEMKDRGIRLEFRAAHGQPQAERICGLTLIAPQAGQCSFAGSAKLTMWEGDNAVRLTLIHKMRDHAVPISSIRLVKGENIPLSALSATVAAGDELVLLPRVAGAYSGGDVVLSDLTASFGASGAAAWRLPKTWEGENNGTARGNPIQTEGKPIWRLDQLWPDDPIMAANYRPLTWSGSNWTAKENSFGGQPEIKVTDGKLGASVRGPWSGADSNHQRVAGVVFIAPKAGVYLASGLASGKPWEGDAKVLRLSIRQKDTQRAAELKLVELPPNGDSVPFEVEVEMAEGHELLFLPLMPDWHVAANTSIENLTITLKADPAREAKKP